MNGLGHKFFISLLVTSLCLYFFDLGIGGAALTFGTTFLTV